MRSKRFCLSARPNHAPTPPPAFCQIERALTETLATQAVQKAFFGLNFGRAFCLRGVGDALLEGVLCFKDGSV